MQQGEPIHGEYIGSTDDAPLILYRGAHRPATARLVRTLGAKEQLVITDVSIVVGAAGTVLLYDDYDDDSALDAGELIIGGAFAINGGIATALKTPHYCTPARIPRIANAGAVAVTVTIHGFLINIGPTP